jgi:thiamine biosynthesis protein ThiS
MNEGMMEIAVNGETMEVASGTTLRSLIERLGRGGQAVAAEVNEELVPRAAQEGMALKPGDRVELVTLVGGGTM